MRDHDLKCGFSFVYLLLWTCAFTYAQRVSYFSLLHILCMIMWFLFLPFACVWTCAFPYAQVVSYVSLLHILCMILWLHILCMIMILIVVSLSSTCYSVNMCIHLCLVRKLLFTASYSLYMIVILNVVSLSSTCYSVNMCIHLCLARKLLFTASYSMYDHDLKCGFSFLHLLLCEHVHSLMFSA